MALDRPTQLLELARAIADETSDFHATKGPGIGDHATNAFMTALRAAARSAFGGDFHELSILRGTAYAADFYFDSEATIVEVALGLPNSASEFEKDVIKAIMAQDSGLAVRRLYFISRAGAIKQCDQPGRRAIAKWAQEKHGLAIEVHELGGEPRKRRR